MAQIKKPESVHSVLGSNYKGYADFMAQNPFLNMVAGAVMGNSDPAMESMGLSGPLSMGLGMAKQIWKTPQINDIFEGIGRAGSRYRVIGTKGSLVKVEDELTGKSFTVPRHELAPEPSFVGSRSVDLGTDF